MEDDSQPKSGPAVSAGYSRLALGYFSRGIGSSAVASAAGIGLAVGVALAVTGCHAQPSASPHASSAPHSSPSMPSPVPAVYAASSPSLLSKVDPSKANANQKPAPASLLMPVAAKTTTAKRTGHRRHHHARKARANNELPGKLTEKSSRKPYVPVAAVAAVEPAKPTALDDARAAEASGPFFVGIEGDVTIAGYEPSTGTIETYEGETYILASNSPATGAINWQNYPFNVNYRCDQIGDCTLMRGRSSASAKLTR